MIGVTNVAFFFFLLYFLNVCSAEWSTTSAPKECWNAIASDNSGQNVAAVACLGGSIYLSKDNGDKWSPTSAPPENWFRISMSSSGQYIVAVISYGVIYYSIDYGTNWNIADNSQSTTWNGVVTSSSGEKVAAVVWQGYIYISSDYGASWTECFTVSQYWSSIAGSSDLTTMIAVAGYPDSVGQAYISTDSGLKWSAVPDLPTASWSFTTCSSTGQYMTAAIYGGEIYYSTNYGLNWVKSNAISDNWFGLSASTSGQDVMALIGCYGTCDGSIYRSTDYGKNFQLASSTSQSYSAVSISGDGDYIYATVYNGGILREIESDDSSDGISTGEAAGIAFGIFGALVIVGIGIYLYYYVYLSKNLKNEPMQQQANGSVEAPMHQSQEPYQAPSQENQNKERTRQII